MHATITNAREKAESLEDNKRFAKKAIHRLIMLSVLISAWSAISCSPVPLMEKQQSEGRLNPETGKMKPGQPAQLAFLDQSIQKKKTTGKFELFRNTTDMHYYFTLKAANGQIILESQGYGSKQSCITGIESVQANAALDQRYERINGETQWSFNLKAANGEVIAESESYMSKAARENGIQSVKQNAPSASVNDLSTH